MYNFYYAKGTAALGPHIALEEVGANYRAHRIDFSQNQQNDEAYLEINPKGRVPSLITPRGVLTETPAILAYISQTWPASNLAPSDPFEFAQAQSFCSYMASTVHIAHAHRHRGARWADDELAHDAMRAKVTQNMAECMHFIESHYLSGKWVLGENYSMCDPYLFVISGWLEADGVDINEFPNIKAHREAMLLRPAVAKIFELHQKF